MSQHPVPELRSQLSRALAQMVEALEILDELEAPGDIGSLLDLAIIRVEEQLGLERHMAASVETLFARLNAEPPEKEARCDGRESPWDAASV